MTAPAPAAAPEETVRPAARRWVLAGLMLAIGLSAMDTTIVATAIPSIVSDLGGFSLFAWVFSGYVLAQAVTIPVYGRLADIYGRKPVLIVGMLVFLAGSILSGVAWSMVALIAFRLLQGLGAGAIQPTVTTLAADLYTLEERARVQGWLASVWGISAVVGPALGGLLSEYASWRWIFYVNVPVGAAALAVVGAYLHERERAHVRRRVDLAGAGLLVAGVGLLVLALLEGGVRWAWSSAPSAGLFAASAALLVVFALVERRTAEPMLPPWVFGRRLLVGASLGSAAVGLLTIGLTTFVPTFAQGVLGVGPVAAGFALAAMSIGWPSAAALSGRFYLRFGFRDTALAGSLVCLAAAGLFTALPEHVGIWEVGLASLVMGVGLGFLSTPLIVGVQAVVDWDRRGVVTGASMFSRQLGQAVGAAVFGSIANATLAAWLADAPAQLAGGLPRTLDDASRALTGGGRRLGPAAAAYVRHGLDLATHRVFLGLLAVAAAALVAVLLTPRRFERLRFGDEPEPAEGAVS